nr:hypothetical protein [uncultured Campylobacter sp.]
MDILAELASIINTTESGIYIDTIRATFLKKLSFKRPIKKSTF